MQLLGIQQSDHAADVLARAFAHDPLWSFMVPDAGQRPLALRQFFRATTPLYAGNAQVYGVGDPVDGVAFWRAPDDGAPNGTALLNVHMVTLLFSPFAWVVRSAFPIFAQFTRMHDLYAPDPHFYLAVLGVSPAAQGHGRASALIRPMLARADAQQCGAYVETMTPSVVPLYEHFGFVCQERFDVPHTDLHIWALYRPPRKA
jgi:GNAT superfamily N-acetyltransferase